MIYVVSLSVEINDLVLTDAMSHSSSNVWKRYLTESAGQNTVTQRNHGLKQTADKIIVCAKEKKSAKKKKKKRLSQTTTTTTRTRKKK